MQYITCQLSIGGNILSGLQTSTPKKTVIMSGETGNELLNRRLGKTNWPFDPNNISVYSAIDMGIAETSCMINTPEGRENIIAIVVAEKPDIIFFDTLISFHTLDESKQGEMTQIYLFLCRIAKAFNCAIVCNHHTRKRPANNPDREQNQDDVIGTSAGVRLANAVYVVSTKDTGEGNSKMTVRNVKNWDKKVPPFSYEFTKNSHYVDFKISHNVEEWGIKSIIERQINDLAPNAFLRPQEIAALLNISTDLARYHLERFCAPNGPLTRTTVLNETAYKIALGE